MLANKLVVIPQRTGTPSVTACACTYCTSQINQHRHVSPRKLHVALIAGWGSHLDAFTSPCLNFCRHAERLPDSRLRLTGCFTFTFTGDLNTTASRRYLASLPHQALPCAISIASHSTAAPSSIESLSHCATYITTLLSSAPACAQTQSELGKQVRAGFDSHN